MGWTKFVATKKWLYFNRLIWDEIKFKNIYFTVLPQNFMETKIVPNNYTLIKEIIEDNHKYPTVWKFKLKETYTEKGVSLPKDFSILINTENIIWQGKCMLSK